MVVGFLKRRVFVAWQVAALQSSKQQISDRYRLLHSDGKTVVVSLHNAVQELRERVLQMTLQHHSRWSKRVAFHFWKRYPRLAMRKQFQLSCIFMRYLWNLQRRLFRSWCRVRTIRALRRAVGIIRAKKERNDQRRTFHAWDGLRKNLRRNRLVVMRCQAKRDRKLLFKVVNAWKKERTAKREQEHSLGISQDISAIMKEQEDSKIMNDASNMTELMMLPVAIKEEEEEQTKATFRNSDRELARISIGNALTLWKKVHEESEKVVRLKMALSIWKHKVAVVTLGNTTAVHASNMKALEAQIEETKKQPVEIVQSLQQKLRKAEQLVIKLFRKKHYDGMLRVGVSSWCSDYHSRSISSLKSMQHLEDLASKKEIAILTDTIKDMQASNKQLTKDLLRSQESIKEWELVPDILSTVQKKSCLAMSKLRTVDKMRSILLSWKAVASLSAVEKIAVEETKIYTREVIGKELEATDSLTRDYVQRILRNNAKVRRKYALLSSFWMLVMAVKSSKLETMEDKNIMAEDRKKTLEKEVAGLSENVKELQRVVNDSQNELVLLKKLSNRHLKLRKDAIIQMIRAKNSTGILQKVFSEWYNQILWQIAGDDMEQLQAAYKDCEEKKNKAMKENALFEEEIKNQRDLNRSKEQALTLCTQRASELENDMLAMTMKTSRTKQYVTEACTAFIENKRAKFLCLEHFIRWRDVNNNLRETKKTNQLQGKLDEQLTTLKNKMESSERAVDGAKEEEADFWKLHLVRLGRKWITGLLVRRMFYRWSLAAVCEGTGSMLVDNHKKLLLEKEMEFSKTMTKHQNYAMEIRDKLQGAVEDREKWKKAYNESMEQTIASNEQRETCELLFSRRIASAIHCVIAKHNRLSLWVAFTKLQMAVSFSRMQQCDEQNKEELRKTNRDLDSIQLALKNFKSKAAWIREQSLECGWRREAAAIQLLVFAMWSNVIFQNKFAKKMEKTQADVLKESSMFLQAAADEEAEKLWQVVESERVALETVEKQKEEIEKTMALVHVLEAGQALTRTSIQLYTVEMVNRRGRTTLVGKVFVSWGRVVMYSKMAGVVESAEKARTQVDEVEHQMVAVEEEWIDKWIENEKETLETKRILKKKCGMIAIRRRNERMLRLVVSAWSRCAVVESGWKKLEAVMHDETEIRKMVDAEVQNEKKQITSELAMLLKELNDVEAERNVAIKSTLIESKRCSALVNRTCKFFAFRVWARCWEHNEPNRRKSREKKKGKEQEEDEILFWKQRASILEEALIEAETNNWVNENVNNDNLNAINSSSSNNNNTAVITKQPQNLSSMLLLRKKSVALICHLRRLSQLYQGFARWKCWCVLENKEKKINQLQSRQTSEDFMVVQQRYQQQLEQWKHAFIVAVRDASKAKQLLQMNLPPTTPRSIN